MCLNPNFVHLVEINDGKVPKYKKVVHKRLLPLTELQKKNPDLRKHRVEVENIDYYFDGYKSRYKYKFFKGSSYDYVMKLYGAENLIPVPCGKCLECRLQQARNWADRCCLEAKNSKNNYFITLTYDDDHLPDKASLYPRDVTLFIKRVRKKYGKNIKFMYSGEYGSSSMRPHYHIIFFNLPLNDLIFDFTSYEGGQPHKHSFNHSRDLMYSPALHKLWYRDKEDKSILGNISVALFSYDTAAYVSQYVTKKINKDWDELYKRRGILPEFLRMSQGIAKSSYDSDYYNDHDTIVIPGSGHVALQPRYFRKLYLLENEFISPERSGRELIKSKIRWDDYCHRRDFDIQAKIREHNLKSSQRKKDKV